MKVFYDFFPLVLFFMTFKLYGMYVATAVGMLATAIQVFAGRLWRGTWDMMQGVTLIVFVLLGSMTLYFHNPIFVKWKPTIIFWIFAFILLGSQFILKKPLLQRLMQPSLTTTTQAIPQTVWYRLTVMWICFFVLLGGLNLYVAYTYSSAIWVDFKFYGITGALLGFSILQAVYLARFLL